MKAVLIERHGGPEVLRLQRVPNPALEADDEVVVRVRACALNHLDLFARRGVKGPGIRGFELPLVSGVDVAGIVEEAGPRAAQAPGDRVLIYPGLFCGDCPACRGGQESMCRHYRIFGEDTWGGLAEFTKVPSRNVFAIPDGLDFTEAAALPVAFTTAWRMLMTVGRVQPPETILVLGAGGGVGSAAVRIAVFRGATVLAVSSGRSRVRKLRQLGVDRAIDRSSEDFLQVVGQETEAGVDLIVNPVGGETWPRAIRCLAPGGRMLICGATIGDSPDFSIREIYQHHRQILGAPLGSVADFTAVVELAGSRDLRPVVDSVFPIEHTSKAHQRLESGQAFGKVVVEVT